MNGFRYRVMEFMQGRYGPDRLSAALFVLYALLAFLRIFFRFTRISYIFSCLMLLLIVCIVFRILSKNIEARRKENEVFCRLFGKALPHIILMKDRIKDRKTKRYRRCPCCKNVLRLPYKKGKHNVRCPKCGKNFSVHIF